MEDRELPLRLGMARVAAVEQAQLVRLALAQAAAQAAQAPHLAFLAVA
jgi:hypothetical protein